jgi:hypothetical protein
MLCRLKEKTLAGAQGASLSGLWGNINANGFTVPKGPRKIPEGFDDP